MEEDHVHCMSCVNQRCMVRPQPGISCDLTTCPLVCGAVFHSCKVDEHHLMCALLTVPCLNSGSGCPAALVRNQMYAHLDVCPAGVVCCTMEWNRWPVSCRDYTSYESLSRGAEEVEQLDVALALQDQRTLLESLQVVAMTPTAGGEARFPAREDDMTTDSSLLPSASAVTESPSRASSSRRPQPPPRGSAKERIVGGINGLNEEHLRSLFRGPGRCPFPRGRVGLIPDGSAFRLRPEMEDKAVDTSDLEQADDPTELGELDPITAALLFCSEEARSRRRISDAIAVDGSRVDFGAQTFTFPAALLVTDAPFRTLRLGLVPEAVKVEAAAAPHSRRLPPPPRHQHAFPFACAQALRRDQFSSHFTNVHGDIHAGLDGWMERRCPLACYGCTFSQRRFYPSAEGGKVVHDGRLGSFGVRPRPRATFPSDSQSDRLSGLPIEILWHVAGFLDSFSLCQLALVSRAMREVCASLLQTRGIVELRWERRRRPGAPGAVSWQIKNRVWRFSTAFSPVLSWGFTDLPSMSNHLKKCHFNNVEHRTEPVPLPAMCTARDGHSLRRVLRHVYT